LMKSFSHQPVLFHETVDGLMPKPDGVYVDCTFGGGGHSGLLLSYLKDGRLIGFDQDLDAIENAKKRFPDETRLTLVHQNFEAVGEVLDRLAPEGIDGAMIDLGVSSHQLDTPDRGFSYHYDAPLDMRMDQEADLTAHRVVNSYSQGELCRILRDYGEEKKAAAIARAIVKRREEKEISTTLDLAEIIKSVFPPKQRFEGKHPARRSFQAIRIEVNRELDVIPKTIRQLVDRLKPGGRLCVITFHSLEDRVVKECIKSYVEGCTCPRDFPVCVCGFRPTLKQITKKPLVPDAREEKENPRSRSAKLRIAEKL